MNDLGITWSDVIDGYKLYKWNKNIYTVIEFVMKNTDYLYINWNGRIYRVVEPFSIDTRWTGLTVEDL